VRKKNRKILVCQMGRSRALAMRLAMNRVPAWRLLYPGRYAWFD
jgi:hypothetical protein